VKRLSGSASRIRSGWTPTMEQRAGVDEAKQVKCLIASEGHEWMKSYFDRLPKPAAAARRKSLQHLCRLPDSRGTEDRAPSGRRDLFRCDRIDRAKAGGCRQPRGDLTQFK
jgi:hypothetical protein